MLAAESQAGVPFLQAHIRVFVNRPDRPSFYGKSRARLRFAPLCARYCAKTSL